MKADMVLYRIAEFLFDAIALLLGIRILLSFFAANQATPVVRWIFDMSQPLIAPFSGIFPNASIGAFVIETSAIIALLVYSIIGYAVLSLVSSLTGRFGALHDHSHAM